MSRFRSLSRVGFPLATIGGGTDAGPSRAPEDVGVRADAYVEPHPFRDRLDAGRRLAGVLREESLGDAVVVGLARGGVEIAA